uniref:Uncharacterized protein n=1 Tax=Anguilla anguilla TaxID=7936 RepID=A0A0E9QLS8_ANGAN
MCIIAAKSILFALFWSEASMVRRLSSQCEAGTFGGGTC